MANKVQTDPLTHGKRVANDHVSMTCSQVVHFDFTSLLNSSIGILSISSPCGKYEQKGDGVAKLLNIWMIPLGADAGKHPNKTS